MRAAPRTHDAASRCRRRTSSPTPPLRPESSPRSWRPFSPGSARRAARSETHARSPLLESAEIEHAGPPARIFATWEDLRLLDLLRAGGGQAVHEEDEARRLEVRELRQ